MPIHAARRQGAQAPHRCSGEQAAAARQLA
jgi:hypothetical protein